MFFYSLLRACLFGCLLCTRHAESAAACYYHSRTLPRSMYGHLGAYNPTKNAAYLFGGASGDSNGGAERITSVYKWDLNSPNSWFTQIDSIPSSAANLFSWIGNGNVAMVGNKAYLVGVPDESDIEGTGKIYVFDTDTEQWLDTDQISLPPVRLLGCVASTATHIFMADGTDQSDLNIFNSNNNRKPFVHVYDIAANSWTSQLIDDTLSLPGGWSYQYCSVVGDALYILGGTESISSLDTALSLIYRINTLTLQVEKLSATLSPGQTYGVGINHDNLIYLVGAFPYKQEIVAFDVLTSSVSAAFTTQESFSSAVVLKINNKIYRFGGERNYVSTDTVEICDLPTPGPSSSPSNGPSQVPSLVPTLQLSDSPTPYPSQLPTTDPTTDPTMNPSNAPTDAAHATTTTATATTSLRPTRVAGSIIGDDTTDAPRTTTGTTAHSDGGPSIAQSESEDEDGGFSLVAVACICGAVLVCICVALVLAKKVYSWFLKNESEAQPSAASLAQQQQLQLQVMQPREQAEQVNINPIARIVAEEDRDERKQGEEDVELEMEKKEEAKEKFVYDPNKNYKPEGARASIMSPTPNTAGQAAQAKENGRTLFF